MLKSVLTKYPACTKSRYTSTRPPDEAAAEDYGWHRVEVCVLWGIGRSSEEVKHSFRDEEAAENVWDRRKSKRPTY